MELAQQEHLRKRTTYKNSNAVALMAFLAQPTPQGPTSKPRLRVNPVPFTTLKFNSALALEPNEKIGRGATLVLFVKPPPRPFGIDPLTISFMYILLNR
jgi:hypothetical protein